MSTIKYLYPHWGTKQNTPSDFFYLALSNYFDGIEINLPEDTIFRRQFQDALNSIKLEQPDFICVLQQVLGIQKESPKDYLSRVLVTLEKMLPYQPNFINSHTGKDHYSFSENCNIIEAIEAFSSKHNIPVLHEIHRGRFTFHSKTTLNYLEKFPNLKFVGDLSHWCVVSESMLEDQEELITKIIPHIHHIHARVGFEQSPQVNHPFAPEWQLHLDTFTQWWQEIIDYHSSKRDMTITPEFGPYPYMPQLPFTKEPLADQHELNCKMKTQLKLNLTY
ncbi:MAG: xylose isomerase [Flavobacteriaceae bacterium]|nr:MAG: xylose isomerase [Flavobacteriaceae bacterium]